MCDIAVIADKEIEELLQWDEVMPAVRQAIISITNSALKDDTRREEFKDLNMINPQRIFMGLPGKKSILLSMPGYIEGVNMPGIGRKPKEASLTCKILNIFYENSNLNPPLPIISGYINLFDEVTGTLQAVMNAERITDWRTAAVSGIAVSLLWKKAELRTPGEKRILAIFGAGGQGRIHAIALQRLLQFTEIRIWNRTVSRGRKLVEDLKAMGIANKIILCATGEQCAQGADVIVTATNATAVILQDDWVKAGAVVNVVGVGAVNEISSEIYKRGDVYVESRELLNTEVPDINVFAELGELELGIKEVSNNPEKIHIFQSRGMGIHDAVVARLVYNKWARKQHSGPNIVKA